MKKHTKQRIACLTITILFLMTNLVFAKNNIRKDESVYVTLNSEGLVKEQIVSDWLHTDKGATEITDESLLKNIINIKGDELPIINGRQLDWKPKGNDIFYQGDTAQKPPVSISIKYYLNGKGITPQKLAGKSGKIRIEIMVTNNTFKKVKVNNKYQSMATQFTTVGIVNLPVDNFKNVTTSTGKIISDGNNQIVAFVAFPGLTKSLGIKQDLIKIPDNVIIQGNATNFKLGAIMAVATPELPEIKSLNEAKSINELTDGINKLNDAGVRLEEGAAKLSSGQKLLAVNIKSLSNGLLSTNKGAKTISSNMRKITSGSKTLKSGSIMLGNGIRTLSDNAVIIGSGAKKLGDGAVLLSNSSQKLTDGVLKLGEGAAQLGAKTGELSEGIKKIAATTEQLSQGETNILSGASDLLNGITQLRAGKEKENQALDSIIPGMDSLRKLTVAISQIPNTKELTDKLLSGIDQQTAGLKSLRDGGDKSLQGLMNLEKGMGNIKEGTAKLKDGLGELNTALKSAGDSSAKLSEAGASLTSALDQLKAGATAINTGANQLKNSGEKLSSGGMSFKKGGDTLVKGALQLQTGLSGLEAGSEKINKGIDQLSIAVTKLYQGSMKLSSGANTISTGSTLLADNIKTFNKDGIKKLDNKVKPLVGKVRDLIGVKDKVIELSKKYKSYAGIGASMEGDVKFIFKTDEIKLDKAK